MVAQLEQVSQNKAFGGLITKYKFQVRWPVHIK
jgi:hypothetical protein